MTAPSKTMTPFHLWISLFPQAPLFGVEWQFAKFFKPAGVVAPVTPPMSAKQKTVAEPKVDEAPAAVVPEVVEATPTPGADAVNGADDIVPPATLYDIAPIDADDLKALKGVGPKLEIMLNEMGIYTLAQIAAFTPANLAWVDDNLTAFKGRPLRDNWVEQAKALI